MNKATEHSRRTGPTRRVGDVGRLAVTLARAPGEVRFVSRLVRSRGANALERGVPWLPYRTIEALEPLARNARVFEYGGGGSTVWFAERAAQVVTVEHDRAWLEALRTALSESANVELLQADVDDDGPTGYVSAIDRFDDEQFDIVLVDGRRRMACLQRARARVRPGGVLVLDDSDREEYGSAPERLPGWERRDFAGLVPCKDRAGHTSVFRRPLAAGDAQGHGAAGR